MADKVGDYKDRLSPILNMCDSGSGIGNLNKPCGVTIDKISDNIYVCDSLNNRVQVFSSEGVPLFVFGHNPLESVRMKNPHSIVIYNNRVTVSQDGKSNGSTACVLVFTIEGDLITAWSLPGKIGGEFRCAYGLAIDETCEELYVCDYCKNKVLIFSNYSPQIDEIAGLFLPISIHLADNYIVILSNNSLCVCEYSYDLQLLNSYIARDWRQVSIPTCLTLDSNNNILITDRGAHCIHIFRRNGTLVRVLYKDIQMPSGIAIDKRGRIILTSNREEHCLQFF